MDRSTIHLPNYAGSPLDAKISRFHPAPSRNDVAILQPVLIKPLDNTSSNSTSTTGVTAGINNNNNNNNNNINVNNNANNANAAGDTLTFIAFHANAILTVSKGAVIRFWVRPLPLVHDRGARRKARLRSTTMDEGQVKEKEDAAVAVEEEDNGIDNSLGYAGDSPLSPVQEDVVV